MKNTESFHIPAVHPSLTHTTSPNINIPHQSGTFLRINEPTLTHCYFPKSIVYMRVRCWCYTFYGFEQMYSDMYLPL